ncbi:MAG: hypothetical protein DHS80DRAFT_31044 [Piptocephalis tieghemiana]|nr:MAG: hypothetical protein DHS80DRAFT_31044 [Piptocephalis tieghemiana]
MSSMRSLEAPMPHSSTSPVEAGGQRPMDVSLASVSGTMDPSSLSLSPTVEMPHDPSSFDLSLSDLHHLFLDTFGRSSSDQQDTPTLHDPWPSSTGPTLPSSSLLVTCTSDTPSISCSSPSPPITTTTATTTTTTTSTILPFMIKSPQESMTPSHLSSPGPFKMISEAQSEKMVGNKRTKQCDNCHTTVTPSWRRLRGSSLLLCNACGLYQRIHGKPRPWYVDRKDGRVKVRRPPILVRTGCANCHTLETPLWRRGPSGECLCNACGLFIKHHGRTREEPKGKGVLEGGGTSTKAGDFLSGNKEETNSSKEASNGQEHQVSSTHPGAILEVELAKAMYNRLLISQACVISVAVGEDHCSTNPKTRAYPRLWGRNSRLDGAAARKRRRTRQKKRFLSRMINLSIRPPGHMQESPEVIRLCCVPGTSLDLVGLQVWKGALMMMECLTGWRDRVDGAILVELGGGPGLPSIYASKYLSPSKVYCTDHLLIRRLDWYDLSTQGDHGPFSWKEQEWNLVIYEEQDVIYLASDVIYDDSLIDVFLHTLDFLLTPASKGQLRREVWLTVEERSVFSLTHLKPIAQGLDYFSQRLHDDFPHLSIRKIPSTSWTGQFPRVIEYSRMKHLQLWVISRCKVE